MPLDPNAYMTLAMVFPIKDLRLSAELLAQLDENDMPMLSQRVFALLLGNVKDFHGTVQTAVQSLLDEKHEIGPNP